METSFCKSGFYQIACSYKVNGAIETANVFGWWPLREQKKEAAFLLLTQTPPLQKLNRYLNILATLILVN
jgi:hypothetical protein